MPSRELVFDSKFKVVNVLAVINNRWDRDWTIPSPSTNTTQTHTLCIKTPSLVLCAVELPSSFHSSVLAPFLKRPVRVCDLAQEGPILTKTRELCTRLAQRLLHSFRHVFFQRSVVAPGVTFYERRWHFAGTGGEEDCEGVAPSRPGTFDWIERT